MARPLTDPLRKLGFVHKRIGYRIPNDDAVHFTPWALVKRDDPLTVFTREARSRGLIVVCFIRKD